MAQKLSFRDAIFFSPTPTAFFFHVKTALAFTFARKAPPRPKNGAFGSLDALSVSRLVAQFRHFVDVCNDI